MSRNDTSFHFRSQKWIECFHKEIDKLKTISKNNGYPNSFVEVFQKTKVVLKVSEKRIYLRPFFYWNKSHWN